VCAGLRMAGECRKVDKLIVLFALMHHKGKLAVSSTLPITHIINFIIQRTRKPAILVTWAFI
jgi:hypothetical protein